MSLAGCPCGIRGLYNIVQSLSPLVAKGYLVIYVRRMVAEGAENFLKRHGVEIINPDSYFSHEMERDGPVLKDTLHGTVGAAVLDKAGRLAVATSTAGIPNKLEGRVGDTPIIGAATFADDRMAISATGQGEYFIRAVAAHSVAAQCRYGGADLADAMDHVLRDMIGPMGGWGGMIAITREGRVRMDFNSTGMHRGYVLEDGVVQVDQP